MAKLTEYPRATSFDEGDILIKDGVNGTKKILVSDASKFMGSEIIMINEAAGENTKVVVTTTNEDISLATTEDLQEVAEDIAIIENKTDIIKTVTGTSMLLDDTGALPLKSISANQNCDITIKGKNLLSGAFTQVSSVANFDDETIIVGKGEGSTRTDCQM